MARETLKSFLNKNQDTAGQDSISFSHNKQGDVLNLDGLEDIDIDAESGKKLLDLFNENVGLLGDYLSYITNEENNLYSIAPGNEEAAPSTRGTNLVIAEEQGSDRVYIVQGTELSNNMTKYSNSQFENLNSIVDKVGNSEDPAMGHELLSSIKGTGISNNSNPQSYNLGSDENVLNEVKNNVLSNSRFANITTKPVFLELNETQDSHESANKKLKLNRQYGSHFDQETLVSLSQLKSLGASLLLKASGYDNGISPGESSDPEEIESLMSNANINSSIVDQTGSPISTNSIKAKNSKGFPTIEGSDESVRSGRGDVLSSSPERKSYGVNYNTGLHFNGKNHKLHKLQAAIAIKAIASVASEYYSLILSSFASSDKSILESETEDQFNQSNFSNMLYGKSRRLYNLRLGLMKETILVPTIYPYKKSFDRGLSVLFDDAIDKEVSLFVKESKMIKQAPGYWMAIASSLFKTYEQTVDKLDILSQVSPDSTESIQKYIDVISSNNLVRFMNAIATVGDASLQAFGGNSVSSKNLHNRARNVDNLPDSPGTRVGKSRKDNGFRDRQLAWSQNDVPSVYLLPVNPIRAAGRLDKIVSGPNPMTAMIGSELVDQTYMSINADGTGGRIPKEVVKSLEDRLDAEYVPFYFQDLRTNEIISFHAFLDQLTDTISPKYNTFGGYGRMDPVRIYESTDRQIQIGFTVLATSKEDFNAMWYKINKFVTLLYPQWTKGTLVGRDIGGATSKFVQPFSQVLSASPLVRMRVGDVIKSNYSRFNLARIFGIGDSDVTPLLPQGDPSSGMTKFKNVMKFGSQAIMNAIKDISVGLMVALYGSPVQFLNIAAVKDFAGKSMINSAITSAGAGFITNVLTNGFANPLTVGLVLNRIKDPNASADNSFLAAQSSLDGFQNLANKVAGNITGPSKGLFGSGFVLLKGNNNTGYHINSGGLEGKRLMTHKPLKCEFVEMVTNSFSGKDSSDLNNSPKSKKLYKLKIIDFTAPADLFDTTILCEPNEIIQIPNQVMINTLEFGILLFGSGGFINPALDSVLNSNWAKDGMNGIGLGSAIDLVRGLYLSDEATFMDPFHNPFTRAIESTSGRGLAGTVGAVTFDWLSDFQWEIDHNGRAPIGCKIGFTFNAIHDLPPGIDHSGYNRAPLYNVGDIMKGVSGDAYDSFSSEEEFRYRNEASKAIKVK